MNPSTPYRCAVIGNPIAHSLSPDIHHAFAQALDLPVQYERILCTADDFDNRVAEFFAQGGRGLNITVPFKERAFTLSQKHCQPRAQLAGAVNTLWVADQQLHGDNTDGEGLVVDLQRLGKELKGQRVLLIGAGGAARGVALPLLAAGAQSLKIINRSPERAHQLLQQLEQQLTQQPLGSQPSLASGGLQDTAGQWDVVINATSASLDNDRPEHGTISYAPQALAYDMVYGAKPTAFMQTAQQQGAAQCVDGLGMLVEQAASSFAIWFGQRPPTTAIRAQLRQQLFSSS